MSGWCYSEQLAMVHHWNRSMYQINSVVNVWSSVDNLLSSVYIHSVSHLWYGYEREGRGWKMFEAWFRIQLSWISKMAFAEGKWVLYTSRRWLHTGIQNEEQPEELFCNSCSARVSAAQLQKMIRKPNHEIGMCYSIGCCEKDSYTRVYWQLFLAEYVNNMLLCARLIEEYHN